MCGIFGVLATTPGDSRFLARALRSLADGAQSRGKDSSGLIVRTGAESYEVFKGAIPVGQLFRSSALRATLDSALRRAEAGPDSFVAFGHSRLVTNGTQLNDENNQPVVKDGLVGIHNGIIVNDAGLWPKHPALKREFQIDTEVALSLVRESLACGYTLPAAIARLESEAQGTISMALLVPDRAALVLYTNNGSLYTLSNGRDVLMFASELFPLRHLADQMRIPLENGMALHQVPTCTGLVVSLDAFAITPFRTADVRRETPSRAKPPIDATVEVFPVGGGGQQLELVPDVAVIARAPEAARLERMLEQNHDRVARLRRCSKCLLPETFPFIQWDAQGVCNYCRHHKIRNQPRPVDELMELVAPYRRRDGTPDCIVPYSGGRDSTYALHIVKNVLKLNPIAFTYDWGMVTDLGRRNIARVTGKLGVENIIVAANIHWKRANIRKNIEAWLARPHLGMIPLFMAGDKYFYYYVEQVKRQTGVPLNLWGVNPMENTEFKVGFLGVPPDHDKEHIYSLSLRRQLALFAGVGGAMLSNPRYLNGSVFDTMGSFFARSIMRHDDYFHLFDYFQWKEPEIEKLILEDYDWEKAIDTDSTWRIGDGTAAFYNYIYFNVAGFSEHDTFRSNQIREGMMTREEGLRRIAEENRPRYPTIRWYADAVGFDYERAIRIINAIPKLYA